MQPGDAAWGAAERRYLEPPDAEDCPSCGQPYFNAGGIFSASPTCDCNDPDPDRFRDDPPDDRDY